MDEARQGICTPSRQYSKIIPSPDTPLTYLSSDPYLSLFCFTTETLFGVCLGLRALSFSHRSRSVEGSFVNFRASL